MSRLRNIYPHLFTPDDEQKNEQENIADNNTEEINDQQETAHIELKEEVNKVDKKVRDMYGNFIQKGDYINYPVRSSGTAGDGDIFMRTAKVLTIDERNLDGDNPEKVLKLAVAVAPRWPERKNNPNWETKIVKTTISQFHRSSIVPKSYIQNDERYKCLLEA